MLRPLPRSPLFPYTTLFRSVAQVDETRARTLLAENRLAEAERVVRYAVHVLDRGDEQAVLAEALNTHGIVLARLRSEEHTSELQSHSDLVCRLLLEKKKT